MKKFLIGCVALFFIFNLFGCGQSKEEKKEQQEQSSKKALNGTATTRYEKF
jgi:uncharacterized lipoprotein YehR (DUF1307 family)